jgi:hypothetical protein
MPAARRDFQGFAIDLGGAVPNPESTACRADSGWLSLLGGSPHADRVFELTDSSDEVETGDIEPLLVAPGQLHLHFADETLIP